MFRYQDYEDAVPFEAGLRNLNVEKHWQKIDLNSYKITKPLLICLGGNGCVKTKDANGICKLFEGMIGLKPQFTNESYTKNDVDVMGFVYSKRLEHSEVGRLKDEDCKAITEKLFMPLFKSQDGKRLTCEQAMKNANKLNFATHCYGATVLNNILNYIEDGIFDLGYSSKEVKQIFSQMVAINYVPETAIAHIPNLQIFSGSDRYGIPCYSSDNLKEVFYEFFDKTYKNDHMHLNTLMQEGNSVLLLTTNMLKNAGPNDDHYLECIERTHDTWESLPKNGLFADIVSKTASFVLASAVSNSIKNCGSENFEPKMTSEDILQAGKDILGKSQIDCETLIEQLF